MRKYRRSLLFLIVFAFAMVTIIHNRLIHLSTIEFATPAITKVVNESSAQVAQIPDGLAATTFGNVNNVTPTTLPIGLVEASRSQVKTVDCYRLLYRDQEKISNSYNYYHPLPQAPIHENCSHFIASRDYPQQPASEEERQFPIAYSFLVDTDFDQIEMLFRAIYQPQNVYCFYVDVKTYYFVQHRVKRLVNCFPNVYFASSLNNVIWGQMGELEADLICMKDLLARNNTWKYFINLTGQEFPLKTNWEIVKLIKAFNGTNIVRPDNGMNTRIQWTHKAYGDKSAMKHNITSYIGRVHVILTRAFVDYAINKPIARDLIIMLNRSNPRIPPAAFFPTLHCNRHLKVPGSEGAVCDPDIRRQKDFPKLTLYKNRNKDRCEGRYILGLCIFGTGDLAFIYERGVKGPSFFANKFRAGFQPLALQCMDKLHSARTRLLGNMSLVLDPQTELGLLKMYLRLYFDATSGRAI